MIGRQIQLLAYLQKFFQGAKSIVMQTSIVFGTKFQEEGGNSITSQSTNNKV